MWRFLNQSQDEFAIHLKGLALWFIAPNGKYPTKPQILWFVLLWTFYAFSFVLITIPFIVEPYDLRRTLFTTFVIDNTFQTVFRSMHLLLFKSRVEKLLQAFQVKPEDAPEEFIQEERKMREHSTRRILKFSAILYFYNTLLLLRTAVPAIISLLDIVQRNLPNCNVVPVAYSGYFLQCYFRMIKVSYCEDQVNPDPDFCDEDSKPLYIIEYWWFTDPLKTPVYYYLFSYNIFGICLYLAAFCSSDAFTCSTIIALVERCNFLLKIAPTALSPDDRGQITPMMKAWIKYHQHYEGLIQMVNQIFGPLVLLTHVFAAGNIMVYVYLILKDKEQEIRELSFSFVIVLAIQFFMYAYWGQQFINKGNELSRATLTAYQVSEGAYNDGPTRATLMVVMARCCGEVGSEITGMGFFSISLKFYARIVSLSFSYLLIVLQL